MNTNVLLGFSHQAEIEIIRFLSEKGDVPISESEPLAAVIDVCWSLG